MLVTQYPDSRDQKQERESLWKHSLSTAVPLYQLCFKMGEQEEGQQNKYIK